jgi:hypothetical protein
VASLCCCLTLWCLIPPAISSGEGE